MKLAYALALILPSLLLLPGCPFDCGAYEGTGDVMYRRGDDALFLCRNGGFTASVGGSQTEGRFLDHGDGIDGASGETGARVFSLQQAADGTWSSPELGTGWATAVLDKTELDHADVQCTDLELRAWWQLSAGALPVTTVFTRPAAGFHSAADCLAAQHAGSYPANAKCEDGVMLCANNRVVLMTGNVVATGTYSASIGEVSASTTAGELDGVFAADGTLRSSIDTWHQIPLAEADPDLVAPGCGI